MVFEQNNKEKEIISSIILSIRQDDDKALFEAVKIAKKNKINLNKLDLSRDIYGYDDGYNNGDNFSLFHCAVGEGNLSALECLVQESEPDITTIDGPYEFSLLEMAIHQGHLGLTKFLYVLGSRGNEMNNILNYAVEVGSVQILKYLLENYKTGCNTLVQSTAIYDAPYHSPLTLAIEQGNVDMLNYILPRVKAEDDAVCDPEIYSMWDILLEKGSNDTFDIVVNYILSDNYTNKGRKQFFSSILTCFPCKTAEDSNKAYGLLVKIANKYNGSSIDIQNDEFSKTLGLLTTKLIDQKIQIEDNKLSELALSQVDCAKAWLSLYMKDESFKMNSLKENTKKIVQWLRSKNVNYDNEDVKFKFSKLLLINDFRKILKIIFDKMKKPQVTNSLIKRNRYLRLLDDVLSLIEQGKHILSNKEMWNVCYNGYMLIGHCAMNDNTNIISNRLVVILKNFLPKHEKALLLAIKYEAHISKALNVDEPLSLIIVDYILSETHPMNFRDMQQKILIYKKTMIKLAKNSAYNILINKYCLLNNEGASRMHNPFSFNNESTPKNIQQKCKTIINSYQIYQNKDTNITITNCCFKNSINKENMVAKNINNPRKSSK